MLDTTFAEMDLLWQDAREKVAEAANERDKLEYSKLVDALLFAIDSGHVLATIRQDIKTVLNSTSTVLCTPSTLLLTKIVALIDFTLKDRGNP
jgi:hypothetical protein